MSSQGPYFGQRYWFQQHHPEKIPSAIKRYGKEIQRVTGVINAHLKKQGTPYLLGGKISYADLVWFPWQHFYYVIAPEGWDWKTECPEFAACHQRLTSRPTVQKVLARDEFQWR